MQDLAINRARVGESPLQSMRVRKKCKTLILKFMRSSGEGQNKYSLVEQHGDEGGQGAS